MYNRKECKPEETVKKIKKILKKFEINVVEKEIININNSFYSTRVELKEIKEIGTNGKGVTKEYALASAYAEFMERLQSNFLLKSSFLNKEDMLIYKDEKYLEYNEFYNKFSKFIEVNQLNDLVKYNDKYRYYTSYENIINNEKEDLPIRLINFLTHSNGLCSGNSKEEALVQGICEIFERYCYKKIIFEEIKVKNIVIKNLEQYPVSEQLRELKNMGFEYKIKDCSLGGKFPVVGFMLLKGNTKYLFTVGSDPNFNIALQRCITEAFQGLKKENIEAKMKNINNCYEKYKEEYGEEFLQNNWLKCYSSNSGIHPNSMFLDNEIDIEKLPFNNVKDNKEALKTILEIAKKNKMNIYIKDYSMMGFNTFKVYIPNFSEIETIKPINLEISANMKKIKNIYFNLFEKQENIEFEKIFYECSKNIKYTELIKPSNLMGINCLVKGEYFALDYFYVFIIYLINLKRYEETIEYIDERLKSDIDQFEKTYLKELKDVISKKSKSKKINEVNYIVFNTEMFLKKIKAPQCPNCKKCPAREKCKYKLWKKINNILVQKYSDYIKNKKEF